MRFPIFVNFATLRGVPLVISFKLSPTLWPFSPNLSISLLLYKPLANFSHFRQICHLLQKRRCDFSPYSPLSGGDSLPPHLTCRQGFGDFSLFWSTLPFSSKSRLSKGLFAISLKKLLRIWQMFAIFVANCKFVIFAKYATFTKIATLNGNP